MHRSRALAPLLALAFLALSASPALARQAEPEQAPSKQEEKARAREQRIQEYLRKKEERRARRASAANAAEAGSSEAAAETMEVADATPRRSKPARGPMVPRQIERINADLRQSQLGKDPTVADYIDLIESGEATSHQLAAFGSFLGEAGLIQEGIAYYGLALSVDDRDPLLWTNVGTLHRQAGEYGQAIAAYGNALGLDRSNAFAHYNLGTVLDEMGHYDDAVGEYKLALTLDPTLGDPAINPQAANNERLLAVRLMLYREGAGAASLPLLKLPGGDLDAGQQDH